MISSPKWSFGCVSELNGNADVCTEKGSLVRPSFTASLIASDSHSSKRRCRRQETTSFCIPSSHFSKFYSTLLLAFIDSNVLNTNISYFSYLGKFVEPAVGNSSHWLLCWRATLHGWGVGQLHRSCEGKTHTVTIIKKGKYVFGRYMDILGGKELLSPFSLKVSSCNKCKVEPDQPS